MDTQQLRAIAEQKGVEPKALDDVTTKILVHFAGQNPPPAEVAAYIDSLYVWDKIGMDKATWDRMPVTWRLEQGERFQAPVDRRATPRHWTTEDLKAVEGKSVHEQLTAGHAGPPQAAQKG